MSPSIDFDPADTSSSVCPGPGRAPRSRYAPVEEVVGMAPSEAEIAGEALAVAALPVAVPDLRP